MSTVLRLAALRRGFCLLLSLTATGLLGSACGSKALRLSAPDAAVAGLQQGLEQLEAGKGALPPQPDNPGLPALDSLDGQAAHGASLAAPGWYELPLDQVLGRAGASFGGGSAALDSNAINGTAYLLYGAQGFEADSGPASARFTVSAVTGQYWVGFSDYVASRWVFSGPFSATAEAEIPNTTPYSDLHSFVSPKGRCYFCIIAPLGTVLSVDKVELGVDGGGKAPRPPAAGAAYAGPAGTQVTLSPSLDGLDPDFAGYVFQRAPLLDGDFATQFGGLTREPTKFDFTVTRLDGQRWRACSVDTSGNRSAWLTLAVKDVGLTNTPPVAHAVFPTGPFYGPQDLTFDLSSSFDPDGGPLATYGLNFDLGPGPLSGPTASYTVHLEPGCYNIVAFVSDGAAPGWSLYRLKVYPLWEGSSTLVKAPLTNQAGYGPNLLHGKVCRDPGGRLALCGQGDGFDFDVLYEVAPGTLRQWSTPLYKLPTYVGEPLWHNGTLLCPFGTSEGVFCLVFDPAADGGAGSIRQLDLINDGDTNFYDPPPSDRVAIAEDANGEVWAFYQADNSGSFDFTVRNISQMSAPAILLPGIGNVDCLDAEARSDGMLEVVMGTVLSTDEYEFDPGSYALNPLMPLALGVLQDIDLEVNPSTDRPAAAFYVPFPTERVRYTEKDGLGVWSVALDVENSAANKSSFSFIYDGPQALVALNYGGQAALYEVDALSSTQRNLPAALAAANRDLDCCSLDGGAAALLAMDDATGELRCQQLNSDGTDAPLFSIPSTQRQGFDLGSAVEGAANLHAIWGNLNGTTTAHVYSNDGGASWNSLPDIGFSPTASLGTNKDNVLALSWSAAGNQVLYTWDSVGSSWVDEGVGENGPTMSRPCLANDPLSADIVWLHYNDVTTKLRVTTGTPGAFASWDVTSNLDKLWMGAIIGNSTFGAAYYGYLDGGGLTEPSGGYVHWSEEGNNTWVHSPGGNDPYCLLTQVAVYGRTFAISRYQVGGSLFGSDNTHVCYTTQGDTFMPQRFVFPDVNGQNISTIAALPGEDKAYFTREQRRTVSAYPAWGRTALAVISGYDGVEQYMEWSNYGDFEELPLPDLGHANYTTVLVGQDGRWHLIYHDVESDEIRCWSTT